MNMLGKFLRKSAIITLVIVQMAGALTAQVSGTVFKDFNFNGTQQTTGFPVEPGVAGVQVKAFNTSNQQVGATATTDFNGAYSITGLTGAVRIEFTSLSGTFDSKAGTAANGTNVQFVTAPSANTNYAISSQGWYSADANPYVATNAATNGAPSVGGTNVSTNGNLYTFPWSMKNTANNGPSALADNTLRFEPNFNLGSIFGLTFQKTSRTLFMAAYLKRHIGFGSGGISAIYRSSVATNGDPGTTSIYVKLVDIGINVGTDPRTGTVPTDGTVRHADPGVFENVGKRGIGGISISDDGNDLYVVNMFEKKLHKINVGNPLKSTLTAADVTGNYVIPAPTGAGLATEWHPMAVKFHQGKVYVGGVLVNEKTTAHNLATDTAGQRVAVFEFDPANNSFTEVLRYGLAYRKGWSNSDARFPTRNNWWNGWQNNGSGALPPGTPPTSAAYGTATAPLINGYSNSNSAGNPYNGGLYYAQPMVADIEFDVDGSMILATRDRLGDQAGYNQPGADNLPAAPNGFGALSNPTGSKTYFRGLTGGEVLRAGKNIGVGYTLEDRGQFSSNGGATIGILDKVSPGPVGLVTDNWGNGQTTNANGQPWAFGKFGPFTGAKTTVASPANGPAAYDKGGYFYANQNVSGTFQDGTTNIPNLNGVTGLSNVAIGAHYNKTSGGIAVLHGSEELGVTLMDPATTTFTSGVMKMYNVVNDAAKPTAAGVAATNMHGNMSQRIQLTATNTSGTSAAGEVGDPLNNGKANGVGDLEVLTNYQPIEIGNRVWIDDNADGVQGAGETTNPGANTISSLTITLRSPGPDGDFATAGDNQTWTTTTDANGQYLFNTLATADSRRPATWTGVGANDILPGFTYRLECPIPTNYRISKADVSADGFNTIDNDGLRTAVGATDFSVVTFTTSQTNHNLDFGFNGLASLGDKVWRDDNKNGIQDAGEPGVSGVQVVLYQNGLDGIPNNADDVLVGSTTTDAFGMYFFDNLTPSAAGNTTLYNVAFTQPANYIFTTQTNTQDAAGNVTTPLSGSTIANGSDAGADGVTGGFRLSIGESDITVDAGIIPNPATPTNSIGDKVWLDANDDGKQDPSELGVSGITVTLYDNAGNVVAITRTDASGNYLFDGLTPNTNYTIGFAILPGTKFTTQNAAGTNADNNSDVNPATRRTAVINSGAAGTKITNIDAGLVNDDRCALGDFVWNDINRDGIQNNSTGEAGVPDVAVTLKNSSNVTVATTTTDVFGVYLFPDLAPGTYSVDMVVPTGHTTTLLNQGGNDRNDSDFPAAAAAGSTVNSGNYILAAVSPFSPNTGLRQDMTCDMGIHTTTAVNTLNTIANLVWNDVNKDGDQDLITDEPGVANVTVRLLNATGTAPVNNPATGKPYVVRSNNSGNYIFADLPDGTYTVQFANLPAGFGFTGANVGANQQNPITGTESNVDSDASTVDGKTNPINLDAAAGSPTSVNFVNIDAGISQGNSDRKGSLGDRVWFDLNNNGVQNGGNETGVDAVRVDLFKETTPGSGTYPATPTATRYTDATGRYLFGGLDAANYVVRFSDINLGANTIRNGYTLSAKDVTAGGGNDTNDSDGNPFNTAAPTGLANGAGFTYTDVIALGQGEDRLTVDLGIVPPANTNTLGDKVFWDNGQAGGTAKDGIQQANEPGVAGIEAVLYTAAGAIYDRDASTAGTQAYATSTDANGNYLFAGLPDGGYKVLFKTFPAGFSLTRPDANAETTGTDSDPNLISQLTDETYVLGAGNRNERNVDAGIVSDKAALGDRVWLDTNGNGIQDAGENGIAGATATLFAANGTTVLATAITDADGRYYFQNLDPGNYVVGFTTLPDGIPFTSQVSAGDNQNNTNSDASPLTGKTGVINLVANENDLTVDAGLAPVLTARVGDLVWIDNDKDGIADADEPGVPGVIATLYNSSNQPVGVGITDGRGIYNITNVAPGNGYYIVFSNTPGFTYTTKDQTAGGGNDTNDSDADPLTGATPPFNLTAGQANITLDAGLLRPASLGDFVWLDEGAGANAKNGIQDADEPGVSGVTVTLFSNGANGTPGGGDDVLIASTVTDAYGKYLFTPLPASLVATGIYNVQFTLPPNFQFTNQTNTQNVGGTATTPTGGSTAANGSDADVVTGRTGGFFLNNGDNERGVDAGLVFKTPAATPTVNSIGDFVWLDEGAGANAKNGVQNVGEPGVAGINVTLLRLNGATYEVYSGTQTDGNGKYEFNDLPVGTYKVAIYAPRPGLVLTTGTATSEGNATTNSDIDNATKESAPVIFAAGVPRAVTGIDAGLVYSDGTKAAIGNRVWRDLNRDGIQQADEPGIANATVRIYAENKTTILGTTKTDAFGYYIFDNLTPSVAPGGGSPSTNGYYVRFDLSTLPGLEVTQPNVNDFDPLATDLTDSDGNGTDGFTQGYFLSPGERNMSVDLGVYVNVPITSVGALGDKVFRDLNGDGIQDNGEPGVPGVRVLLLDAAGNPTGPFTYTDENGNYIFPGLTPGNYGVQFTNLPKDFIITKKNIGTDLNADSDADPFTGKSNTVAVTANNVTRSVDAGITKFKLSGLATLGNRVWYDLNNNGKQDDGELGVQAAIVELFKDANGDGTISGAETTLVATERTNALGEYIFGGLTAGCYQVSFKNLPAGFTLSPKGASGVTDALDSDGNPLGAGAAGQTGVAGTTFTDLLCIKEGDEVLTLDLGIAPPPNTNTLGNKVWVDVNRNDVQDPTEPGVPGVVVTLLNGSGNLVATTTTNSRGEYLFAGLPDGNYSVRFTGLPTGFNYVNQSVSNDAVGSDADPLSGATPIVTLGATNRNDRSLDAGLKTQRAALGNYVWNDLNDDGVQDANEPGIAGALTVLYRRGVGLDGIQGNADDALPVASMITDENGFYLYPNLEPNTLPGTDAYFVEFSKVPVNAIYTKRNTPGDNGNDTNSDAVPVSGDLARSADYVLAAREVDLTVDAGITNNKPATIGDKVWSDFDGNGVQDIGEPGVPGVVVTLFNAANQPIGSAVTDGFGNWSITEVSAGTGYYVTFNANLGPNFNTGGANPGWTAGTADAAGVLSSGNENGADSDIAPGAVIGQTGTFTVAPGDNFPNIDAGIINYNLQLLVPIQLVSFTASPIGRNVLVNWVVATETDILKYEVEHSADGRNFAPIATSSANGNRNYGALHTSPKAGVNYYRLKVYEANGTVTYSEVRRVNFSTVLGDVKVYPVPATSFINISIPSVAVNTKATLSVVSVDGRIVAQRSTSNLSATERLELGKLANGKYILRIVTNDGVVTKQFEIVR